MSTYSQIYKVTGYQCDQDSTLATPFVFNYLQDSLDNFSRAHGVGYDFCKTQNLTYILKGYDVQIHSLPHWTDITQMDTDLISFGPGSLFFLQNLYDSNKKLLFSSVSHVVLLDLLKKRPARIKDHFPSSLLQTATQATPAFTSLKPLDCVHTTREQEITPDYIDFNQHVNNTHYITFAERALDPVFLKKARLKRIRVAYKQAALLGDKLKVESKIAPGFTDHQISSVSDPTKQFARIRFSWLPKAR
ncbi:MAG: hypothetical protein II938_04435 [Alphaproteobacteria bacterium]|nr:hypothetical protein [Alphaproteobacteria bacterium]